MAYKTAHFKTGWLQREIVLEAKVSEDLVVGALCTLTEDTLAGAEDVATATHIVAQSDMTLGYGHIPVELRDYKYDPKLVKSDEETKKVALFRIVDPTDVILDNKA